MLELSQEESSQAVWVVARLDYRISFFLAGFEYVITQLKSVVLSLGIIDRHLSVEKAVLLSRLEEEYQVGGQSIILSAISGVDI